MSQANPNRVIFIAGAGRSGSTLLDMLLGQVDGFCSTGELRFIWKRGFGQNQLCGCGKPFRECEFWTAIIREAFGGFEKIDHGRIEQLRPYVEAGLARGPSAKGASHLLGAYRPYFEACQGLYRAIKEVSGCEYIVDSSKNIANGFILSTLPEIDLFTVHLMRDSRAVAYSWRREKVRPEVHWERRLMGQRGILKSATRWNSLNMLGQQLRRTSKNYTLLRYEDLVSRPKEILSRLFEDLAMEGYSLDFLDGTHANLKTSHTVSGNPVRFTSREIKIQPDVQWRDNMARHQKLLVTLLTWPLLLKHGYFQNDNYPRNRQEVPAFLKG